MTFTYESYQNLITLLQEQGYAVADYHNYADHPRCVILRHDVDNSPAQALKMAELEAEMGVSSTYFFLLRTDFYNPASRETLSIIRRIHDLGHEVGLHFDEMAYNAAMAPSHVRHVPDMITLEADIMSRICGFPVITVSMHRPSKETLAANYEIPGMVNSYGQTFFHDFKYLSDSRRRWREPVLDIVRSGEYDRLHILTHAFWYHENDLGITQTVGNFVRSANPERYAQMLDNITDLPSILPESEL